MANRSPRATDAAPALQDDESLHALAGQGQRPNASTAPFPDTVYIRRADPDNVAAFDGPGRLDVVRQVTPSDALEAVLARPELVGCRLLVHGLLPVERLAGWELGGTEGNYVEITR